MPARLIINADDFGLTVGINRAIEDLHRAGVLTSATLMANGTAFEDAVNVAQRNPSLGVGCHVVLTDGTPVSPPASIPSLIGPDGKSFHSSLSAFGVAALTGRLRDEDIRAEALAQVFKLQAAGILVTHLDTHKHAHLFPAINRPLMQAARLASVRAVRNPFEPPWTFALRHGSGLRRLQLRALNRSRGRFLSNPNLEDGSVTTTHGTIGISATGSLDSRSLRQLLERLPDGTWELVCHPGYNDSDLDSIVTRLRNHRETERAALLEVIPWALREPGAPVLIDYGELARAETTGSAQAPPASHPTLRSKPAPQARLQTGL